MVAARARPAGLAAHRPGRRGGLSGSHLDSGIPIRIVHLITDLDVGGAELMLARLAETLAETGVEGAVISLGTRGALGDRIAHAGIPLFSLDMRPGRPDALAFWRLLRLVRRLRPTVVQTWLYHADFLGLIAGRLAGVPVVWNLRCAELDLRDHPRSLKPLLTALALASRYPSAVICNSSAGRRAHEQLGYAPRRWAIIPNGFDTAVFAPSASRRTKVRHDLGVTETTPLVGVVARWHPMKDHATFARAAAMVRASRLDVRFVLAGRGMDRTNAALRHLIDENVLSGATILCGEVSDAAGLFAALDVAVSSSYSEAFPNVVGEAMACGTPCVVTDVGDAAHIVGDAGIVVPPRDPAALAEGILRLLDLEQSARDALGRAARERILSEFSLARVAAEYEALYRDIAGLPGSLRPSSACVG
jgi:glycosyltransferase involved in cell wall biosynthesis